MKVTVDQDACTGSGQCVLSAPEVFDQRDSDGIVVLLNDGPDPRLHEKVREAARICPALAITLTRP
ncbi:ferredoxin [Nonomuraea diastatica]|uniref:Ferredoxin n=1 Tax=Nonomuraea diastatica TaxID=1848329 RepID=A0A4R4WY15_9ACTN|nr:ferredoxin [Nonomuraea diastatica]TDD22572.1 ferredoxin [Nonomuraea diastatica]